MNDDIENNSLMANYKDCRPADFNSHSSLFTNTTIAESKAGKKGIHVKANDTNTLSINKTVQEKDNAKRLIQERHNQHLAKVNNRKATLSHHGGNTLSMRSVGGESQGNGIIKTVILPNEEINRLAIEQEELRQYLQAQRQVYEESIAAYEKDRLIREEEYQMKEQEFRDTLALVKGRLDQRQAVNYQLARDFFDYKHLVGKTRQRLQDEQDLAQVENQALKNQLDKLLDAVKHETKYSEKLFDQKTSNHAHRFRKLSKENEEDLAIVKVQYGQVQQKYLS